MANPVVPVTCYKLVCPVCGVAWDDGLYVPYFNTRAEAAEYVEACEGENLGRALARKCRIIGCGEAAYDKMQAKGRKGKKR